MENRTLEEIIHDMEGIIFTRARRTELNVVRHNSIEDVYIWNEYKVLLERLGLTEQYDELYG